MLLDTDVPVEIHESAETLLQLETSFLPAVSLTVAPLWKTSAPKAGTTAHPAQHSGMRVCAWLPQRHVSISSSRKHCDQAMLQCCSHLLAVRAYSQAEAMHLTCICEHDMLYKHKPARHRSCEFACSYRSRAAS